MGLNYVWWGRDGCKNWPLIPGLMGSRAAQRKKNPGFAGGKSVFRNSISLNTVDPESQVWRGWIAAQRKKTAFNPGGGLVIIWDGARTNSHIRRTSSHAAFAGFANQFSGVCRESCASSLTRKSCFGAVSVVYSLFRCWKFYNAVFYVLDTVFIAFTCRPNFIVQIVYMSSNTMSIILRPFVVSHRSFISPPLNSKL